MNANDKALLTLIGGRHSHPAEASLLLPETSIEGRGEALVQAAALDDRAIIWAIVQYGAISGQASAAPEACDTALKWLIGKRHSRPAEVSALLPGTSIEGRGEAVRYAAVFRDYAAIRAISAAGPN